MPLNEEQLAIVNHPFGTAACVIAGAGSGKTTTLIARIQKLLDDGIPANKIGVVTFSNRAANEVLSRLKAEKMPRVSTIHSLSLSFIRRNPEAFGLSKPVSLLDDYDQHQMVKRLADSKDFNPWQYLKSISYHRAHGVGFRSDYTEEVHKQTLEFHYGQYVLSKFDLELWEKFENEKKKMQMVDFDDMLHLVLRRADKDRPWAEAVSRMFEHVLVDEVQDISEVQWKFINLLLHTDNRNLFCVGDLSQSIFRFIGAEPKLLKEFSESWRGTPPTLYKLTSNYRSVSQVVNLANAIQKTMTGVVPIQMLSFRKDGGTIKVIKGGTPSDVAQSIASTIARDAGLKSGMPYADNCILVRASSQVRDIEMELIRYRIPYVVHGGGGLLTTEEARDMLAYMKLAVNPKDLQAFSRAIAVPKRGVGEASIKRISETGSDLLAACLSVNREKFGSFVDLIRRVQGCSVENILKTISVGIAYPDYLRNKYKKEPKRVVTKLENLDRLGTMMMSLEEDGASLGDIVFQLSMGAEDKDEDGTGKVVVSTIHAMKGGEARRVFVTNVIEGSIPHKFSMGSDDDVEEERRMLYVACTRAKDVLVICTPDCTMQGPNSQRAVPSRFLREAGIV